MDTVLNIRISLELKEKLYEVYGKNASSRVRELIELDLAGEGVGPIVKEVEVDGKKAYSVDMKRVVRGIPKVKPGCLGKIAHESGTCGCWE